MGRKSTEGHLGMRMKRGVPFTLRQKMILILLAIFLAMGLIGFLISNNVLLQSVSKIEERLIDDNISRVRNILNEEIKRLKIVSLDWGHWDDTYYFTLGKNPDFLRQNLFDDIFYNNKWTLFLIFDPKFKLVYGKGYNLETKKVTDIPLDLNDYFYPDSYFFKNIQFEKPAAGLALIDNTLQFVSAIDLRHSDRKGPMVGYLVLTRALTRESLLAYSKNLELPLHLNYLNTPQSISSSNPELLKNNQLIKLQENAIHVELLLKDVNHKPVAIISFEMPRNIYKYSVAAINFFLGLLLLTGLISLVALGLLINLAFIKRVRLFNNQIIRIAQENNYRSRVDIAGNDELTSMATQVNFLLDVIQNSQKKLQNRMETINKINSELKMLELEKRNIIEYTPEPIVITDNKSEIKLINDATKKTFSCQFKDVKDKPIDELFSLQSTNKRGFVVTIPLSAQEGSGAGKQYLIKYKKKSVPIELKTALINNDSKIYILHDISERKKHEKELALLNQKLMMVSREAGMTDVSRMLLHNIGNILNSVLVTSSLMQEEIVNSRLNYLEQVSNLFKQNADRIGEFLSSDEKGKKIPQYMVLLGEQWESEKTNLLSQMKSMKESIDKIIMVIRNFQFHHASTVIEKINLTELMDNVLDIHLNRFKKHGIELVKHYSAIPIIEQDRFKIWHIMNNLITNAIDAVKIGEPQIPTVELFVEEIKNGVRLKVKDNGVGIAAAQLVAIFLFRHTSKPEGSGIGLHSSSILAQEIGATLTASSDGVGKGATFTLDIPREIPKKQKKLT